MPFASQTQEDWGGGIYRGRRTPQNAAYDIVNGLLNSDAQVYRRGGSVYQSGSAAAAALLGLWDGQTTAGQRTLFWTSAKVYVLSGDDSSILDLPLVSSLVPDPSATGTTIGGLVAFPATTPGAEVFYAGSRKTASYAPAPTSVTFTNGSATVAGSGTSFSSNIDAGMIVAADSNVGGVVKSVESDTSLTLTAPWPGSSGSPVSTVFHPLWASTAVISAEAGYLATAGQRLLRSRGTRVYYSPRLDDAAFFASYPGATPATDYHDLPSGSLVIGADALNDTALLFTTRGVWAITNLALDDIDAFGNVQHIVQQVSQDLILWGEPGIAAWSGRMILPAVDDVYLFGLDGPPLPITGGRGSQFDDGIRSLYRGYVKAGYQPGTAAVHRGALFLPVLNGTTLIDVLVCHLDKGFAWTRWAGHAAGNAYQLRIGAATRTPKLLGIAGTRVTDLTGTFTPTSSNALDADGTTSDFELVTRDYPTGANQPGFAQKIRARYEMEGVEASTSDDFERANESPLSSPYTAWTSGITRPNLASGAAVLNGSASDTTRPETVGPGCFAQVDFEAPVASDGITSYYVGARLTAHSAAANGYSAWLDPGTGGWRVRIREGSAFATIKSSATVNYGNVSGLKITCVGSTITAYVNLSGIWTEAATVEDSTYSAAGYVGFGIQAFFGSPTGVEAFTWGSTPQIVVEFSSDADDDVYTALTERGEQNGSGGWADSDGSLYQWALVAKRRERIRFRLTVVGATAQFVLRTLELLTRPSGKQ